MAPTSVSTCDETSPRADLDVVQGCETTRTVPTATTPCAECDCTKITHTTSQHGPFDDVVLTGIPDLWQFDACGSNAVGANACQPGVGGDGDVLVGAARLANWSTTTSSAAAPGPAEQGTTGRRWSASCARNT
jgi:hypothetical protein